MLSSQFLVVKVEMPESQHPAYELSNPDDLNIKDVDPRNRVVPLATLRLRILKRPPG